MKNPLVSVIVTCYNYASYLDEALQSILEQTFIDWECIIINDGSTDNTDNVAKNWVSKDQRFQYISKNNEGVSTARNHGIEKAKGEYIVTLDADDKYEKTFIEKAVAIADKNKEIGIVNSWGVFFGNNKKDVVFKTEGEDFFDFLFRNAAIGTALFRKECWEKVGGYDNNPENGYEDWEFFLRVANLGWRAHVIEEVLFYYRQHNTSRRVEMGKKDIASKKYIYLKNKAIYLENYDHLIEYFLNAIEKEKKNTKKMTQTKEFRIGTMVLKPFRVFRKLFFKNN
jgi:glycosyltransferase involved in cell wall biosynthesis